MKDFKFIWRQRDKICNYFKNRMSTLHSFSSRVLFYGISFLRHFTAMLRNRKNSFVYKFSKLRTLKNLQFISE